MLIHNSFRPTGDTVNLSVTSTSGTKQVLPSGGPAEIRLVNAGTDTVFVKFVDTTTDTVTTGTGIPILPNQPEVFTVRKNNGFPIIVAAITASATCTLYMTPGFGN